MSSAVDIVLPDNEEKDQLILSRKKVKISGMVNDTVMEDDLKDTEVVSSPKDTDE